MNRLFTTMKRRYLLSGIVLLAVVWGAAQLVGGGDRPGAGETALLPSGEDEALESGIYVAVLPFDNVSGDPGQDALVDGITDEIGGVLAKIPDLNVGARASAFRYKAPDRNFRAIGEALHRTHFVEGSMRKVDDRIRISARLIRADDGVELWSQDYYTEFAAIFDIEEDIAKSVANALDVPLGIDAGGTLVGERTSNMSAYEKYVRARPLIRARGRQPFADAAGLLEEAVAEDPDFAPAAALLAFDYDLSPLYQQSLRSGAVADARAFVDEVIPKAEALAQRATELAPENAEAHVALAYADMVQRKMLNADETFRKALALDPAETDALHGYSQLLAALGYVKEALVMRQKLQALEPFITNYVADTAEIYWLDGDNETALRMLDQFRPGRTAELAQIRASMGEYETAASLLREMPSANYLPGVLDSAASLLDSAPVETASPESLPRLGNLGFVYLHVGAPERVFEYYEGNVAAGYFQPISTTWFWHPSYAQVRKTQRFKDYMREIGFVDVWRDRGWPALCRPEGTDDFACD